MDIYTPENMIRFLYQETSAEETAAMQIALDPSSSPPISNTVATSLCRYK